MEINPQPFYLKPHVRRLDFRRSLMSMRRIAPSKYITYQS